MSKALIFLPMYSGVRPTISPAMNTVKRAKASMPYKPQPTPPKTTSPSCIRNMVIMPPRGVRESCIALTEPLLAAVVAAAHKELPPTPKRVSFPSMLPPRDATLSQDGAPKISAQLRPTSAATKITVITIRIVFPCRVSLTAFPKVKHRAAGISSKQSASITLDSGVAFSYGNAELTPKKPPPLVPNCLMAI